MIGAAPPQVMNGPVSEPTDFPNARLCRAFFCLSANLLSILRTNDLPPSGLERDPPAVVTLLAGKKCCTELVGLKSGRYDRGNGG
jgi:hypothetical protein